MSRPSKLESDCSPELHGGIVSVFESDDKDRRLVVDKMNYDLIVKAEQLAVVDTKLLCTFKFFYNINITASAPEDTKAVYLEPASIAASSADLEASGLQEVPFLVDRTTCFTTNKIPSAFLEIALDVLRNRGVEATLKKEEHRISIKKSAALGTCIAYLNVYKSAKSFSSLVRSFIDASAFFYQRKRVFHANFPAWRVRRRAAALQGFRPHLLQPVPESAGRPRDERHRIER